MKDFFNGLLSLFSLGYWIVCFYHLIDSAFVHVNLEVLPHYILCYFIADIATSLAAWFIRISDK